MWSSKTQADTLASELGYQDYLAGKPFANGNSYGNGNIQSQSLHPLTADQKFHKASFTSQTRVDADPSLLSSY